MLKQATFLAALLCAGGAVQAGALPQPGDFYLISRDRGGNFVGSHKLFLMISDGLKQASYCNRDYFVRSHSVAWVQLEVERGNTVRLEYNFGHGWRPICENPEREVTLEDLGITLNPQDVLATPDQSAAPQNRLSAIGAMFKSGNSGSGNGTYHTR
jgi:hypothetical protein